MHVNTCLFFCPGTFLHVEFLLSGMIISTVMLCQSARCQVAIEFTRSLIFLLLTTCNNFNDDTTTDASRTFQIIIKLQ